MEKTAPTAAAGAGQPPAQNRTLSAAMAAAQFAGESGESYVPRAHWGSSYLNYAIDGKPLFTWMDIDRMSNDPQIILGMLILRAPLYQAKWKVEGDPKQAEYVDSILKRFWRTSLASTLTFLEWGVAVGGVKHRRDKANPGKWEFDRLIPFAPHDCKPLIFNEGKRKGKLAGIHVESNETTGTNPTAGGQFNLYSPKAFWFRGYSKYGELYGRPRLAGAHQPFLEKNGRHGALDSRRLWFHKNAFSGPTVKHPLGVVNLGSDASPSIRSNESYARELGEKAANGHVMTLPSINGPDGKPLWDFLPGQSFAEVAGLRDYPKDLDEEMFTGLGIPMELVKAAAVGSGYSGRSIPAQMFFTSMDETVVAIIDAVDEMIVKPLVRHRFGAGNENYEIMPQSLAEEVAKQDPNAGGGDGRPRDASGHYIPKGQAGGDASGMGGAAGQPATSGNPPMGDAGKAMMGKLGLSDDAGDVLTADELDVLQRVKELAEEKWPVALGVDAKGHDHKGKGPGGGQFIGKTSKGKDGSLETHHDEAAGKKVVADKGKAIKSGLERARHFSSVANGMVPVPLLLREAQRADPSLTLAELHDGLQTLWKGKNLQMHVHNEVRSLKPEEQVGIHSKEGGYYHYVLDQSPETRKKEDWDKGSGSATPPIPGDAKATATSAPLAIPAVDALPPDVFSSAVDHASKYADAPKGGANIGTLANVLHQRGHTNVDKLKASVLAAEKAGKVELIEHVGESHTIPGGANFAIHRDGKFYAGFRKKPGVELSDGAEAGHPPAGEHDAYDSTDDVHASAYAYFLSKAADLAETDPDKLQEIADVIGELIENPDYLDHDGDHSHAGRGGQPAEPAVALGWEDHGTSRSGKHRWRDSATHRVRYQERRPGERKEKQGEATAALQKIEAELETGEITREHVATILQHAEHLRKDQVSRLATHLQNSYGAKGIGGKGEGVGYIGLGKAKKEMVGRIDAYVNKVLEGHQEGVPNESPTNESSEPAPTPKPPAIGATAAAIARQHRIDINAELAAKPASEIKAMAMARGIPTDGKGERTIKIDLAEAMTKERVRGGVAVKPEESVKAEPVASVPVEVPVAAKAKEKPEAVASEPDPATIPAKEHDADAFNTAPVQSTDSTQPDAGADRLGGGTVDGRHPSGTDDGVSGGIGATRSKPRVIVAREHLTPKADPALVPERLRQHLTAEQREGVAHAIAAMTENGVTANFDGAGFGKSRQLLGVGQAYLDKGKKVLLISPAGVIKPNWAKGVIDPENSLQTGADAMGVKMNLTRGEDGLKAGVVNLSTYQNLSKLKGLIDKDTVLLFDEAHSNKNSTTATAKNAGEMMRAAHATMHATATPGDKPLHIAYLLQAGTLGAKSKKEIYEELGMQLVARYNKYLGKDVHIWEMKDKKETARRLSGFFDRLTEDGMMLKRELSMDGVDVGTTHVTLSPQDHDDIQKVYNDALKGEGGKAFALMAARRAQEPLKIPAAVDYIKAQLATGRQPVIFMGTVNKKEDEDGNDDDSQDGAVTAIALRKALIDAGVSENDIGEMHGAATKTPAAKAKAMKQFNDGKTKILLTTIQSGGTGVNLDDTVGDRPRSALLMTPPLSANDAIQAAGRIHRMNTKSNSKVDMLFSDSHIDQWNGKLLANKMANMGASHSAASQYLEGVMPEELRDEYGEQGPDYKWSKSLGGGLPVQHYTQFHEKDVAAKFGGKSVNLNRKNPDLPPKWTTEFPNQKALDAFKAATAPKPTPPAVAAPDASPATPATTSRPAAPSIPLVVHPDRKSHIHAMLKSMAGNDGDGAREINGIGFNQMDSATGRGLASQPSLSDIEAHTAAGMLQKYHGQLGKDSVERVKSNDGYGTLPEAPKPAPAPVGTKAPHELATVKRAGSGFVHSFPLRGGHPYWDFRKVGDNKNRGFSAKNFQGDWQGNIWGDTEEQVRERVKEAHASGALPHLGKSVPLSFHEASTPAKITDNRQSLLTEAALLRNRMKEIYRQIASNDSN